MKYLTQSWDKKYDGVLYFIQRLEEMLFHYSDDIVKAPIHNTATLILEYIAIDKNESIMPFHKDLIVAELISCMQKDKVLLDKFGKEFIDRIIVSLRENPRETVYYLHGSIELSVYHTWCEEYIIKVIHSPNYKCEIESGLRLWISSVIGKGYSSAYVYRFLKKSFENEVSNPIQGIIDFLQHFDNRKEKYSVYFLFMNSVARYKQLLTERLDVDFDDGSFDKVLIKDKKTFVGRLDVKAIDFCDAFEKAYGKIDIFVSFYRVLSNRKKPLLGKNAFIKNTITQEEMFWRIDPDGYNVIEIEPHTDLREEIDEVVLGCQAKKGYPKLRKMITLHNMALNQIDYDDSFVNLWSIMEIASSDSFEKTKIEKVIKDLLPILQNDYYPKYFDSIECDLRQCLSREKYEALLECISELGEPAFKIACFTLLEKYEKERERLFDVLDKYPNIRQRIYNVYDLRKNKSDLFSVSHNYAQRLKWHIYRLYRIRNGIVHAGEQNKNTRILGEHLHIYCDGIIYEIIFKLSSDSSLSTVQDVLVDTKLLLEYKKKYFSSNEEITEKDVQVLFYHYFKDVLSK